MSLLQQPCKACHSIITAQKILKTSKNEGRRIFFTSVTIFSVVKVHYSCLFPTYGGEGECGPVEAVDVLSGQRAVSPPADIVNPVVRAEPYGVADSEVETGGPVD